MIQQSEEYSRGLQQHYERVMSIIASSNKAAKDVVGKSYEEFRTAQIKKYKYLDVASPKEAKEFRRYLGNEFTADQYIVEKESRKILAVEEDKGHYVDKCFAKRAIFNAAEVFSHCNANNIEAPYFILSCPTMFAVDELIEGQRKMFNDAVPCLLKYKFKFFYACTHGRTSRFEYLVEESMPFEVDPVLVAKEVEFFNKLSRG